MQKMSHKQDFTAATVPQAAIDIFAETAQSGDVETLQDLFKLYGSAILDCPSRLHKGNTPVAIAGTAGRADCLGFLIEKGANCNIKNDYEDPPLILAVIAQHNDCMEMLLKAGALVNACDSEGATALFLTAFAGQDQALQKLIDYDADINQSTKDQWTPLMVAVSMGHIGCVLALVNAGANPNLINSNGATAHDLAHSLERPDIISLLQQASASRSHSIAEDCALLHQGTQKSIHAPKGSLKLQKPPKNG